jgi:hypothetical protein
LVAGATPHVPGKPRVIAKITENITNRKKSFQVELRDLVGTSTKFARWTPDDRVESASACAFRVCARALVVDRFFDLHRVST